MPAISVANGVALARKIESVARPARTEQRKCPGLEFVEPVNGPRFAHGFELVVELADQRPAAVEAIGRHARERIERGHPWLSHWNYRVIVEHFRFAVKL